MSYAIPIIMLLLGLLVVLALWRFTHKRFQKKPARPKTKTPTQAEVETFLAEIEKFRRNQGENGPP